MEQTNFEKTRIYQLAETISNLIWEIVTTWEPFARDTLGKQLVRAADSIGANIAEGSGRGSSVDYRKFLRIARGSLYETKSFLRRAHTRQLLTTEQMNTLKPLVNELAPKLNAYIKRVDANISNT